MGRRHRLGLIHRPIIRDRIPSGNIGEIVGGGGEYLPSDNPTSLIAWFRMGVGITESGGFASVWADQSGNGNDLSQATGTKQPAYSAGVLTFDGIDNFMKCSAFTLNQPIQVSILAKQVSFTNDDYFCDGNTTDSTVIIFQSVSSPNIACWAGPPVAATNTNMTLGSFFAVSSVCNGASTSIKVGTTTVTTGTTGAANAGGFTLGSNGGGTGKFCDFEIKECIVRNVDDATIRADDHAYLQTL